LITSALALINIAEIMDLYKYINNFFTIKGGVSWSVMLGRMAVPKRNESPLNGYRNNRRV